MAEIMNGLKKHQVYSFDLQRCSDFVQKRGIKVFNKDADFDVNFVGYAGADYGAMAKDFYQLLGKITYRYDWHVDIAERALSSHDFSSDDRPTDANWLIVQFLQ